MEEIETPAFPRMKRSEKNREKPPAVSLIWCLEAAGPDMPGVLWAGTIPGALFKSGDRGDSWELNKPLWRRPERVEWLVAVMTIRASIQFALIQEIDEARYPANAGLVVTRTRDGGKTFQTLSRGLPQQHAYDLVYRHALDVDDHGERLAMGSTSGTLWVSEDGGDDWDCVSPHLPPIYSVRFG